MSKRAPRAIENEAKEAREAALNFVEECEEEGKDTEPLTVWELIFLNDIRCNTVLSERQAAKLIEIREKLEHGIEGFDSLVHRSRKRGPRVQK